MVVIVITVAFMYCNNTSIGRHGFARYHGAILFLESDVQFLKNFSA